MTATEKPSDPRRASRRLNLDTFPDHTRHIALWHLLIHDTDRFTEATGLGLADVWHHIKTGNYEIARARLDDHTKQIDPTKPQEDHMTDTTIRYDAQQRRLCAAHRKDGQPCNAPAMDGQRICAKHGGSSPQAKRAARLRMLDLIDPAITQLARIVASPDTRDTDRLKAIEMILDRTGYPKGYQVTVEDARAVLADRLAEGIPQEWC